MPLNPGGEAGTFFHPQPQGDTVVGVADMATKVAETKSAAQQPSARYKYCKIKNRCLAFFLRKLSQRVPGSYLLVHMLLERRLDPGVCLFAGEVTALYMYMQKR